jgi:Uma2 family endonuclease
VDGEIEERPAEDRMQRLMRKLEDYSVMGIPEIWLIDDSSCEATPSRTTSTRVPPLKRSVLRPGQAHCRSLPLVGMTRRGRLLTS